jgi:hypothetical protein
MSRIRQILYDPNIKPLFHFISMVGLCALLGWLANDAAWAALLPLSIATLLARWLGKASIAFFVAGLLGAILLRDQNVFTFAVSLFKHAGDEMMLLIFIFSGVIALLQRRDLQVKVNQNKDDPERYAYCLLERLVQFHQNLGSLSTNETVPASKLHAGMLWLNKSVTAFLITTLLAVSGFASSVVSVMIFKSFRANSLEQLNQNSSNYIRFAPLCLCTVGALLLPFSPLWLFLDKSIADILPLEDFQLWPIATWTFASLSLIHGNYLLVNASTPTSSPIVTIAMADAQKRYILVLLTGILISGLIAVVAFNETGPIQIEIPDEVVPTELEGTIDIKATNNFIDEAKHTKRMVGMVGILALMVLLTGQTLTITKPLRRMGNGSEISSLFQNVALYRENLKKISTGLLDGMKSGFEVVVLITVVLALRDVVQTEIEAATIGSGNGVLSLFSLDVRAAIVLLGMAVLGYFLGSSFGVFAIGMTLLSAILGISDSPTPEQFSTMAWSVDALIVIAALSNQWSPAADNWYAAVVDGEEQPVTSSIFRIGNLMRVASIQAGIALMCILMSVAIHKLI